MPDVPSDVAVRRHICGPVENDSSVVQFRVVNLIFRKLRCPLIAQIDQGQAYTDNHIQAFLREQIYRLEITPEIPLEVNDLVEQLRVGRNVVRKALLRLASEGLVEPNPHGYNVVAFDDQYITQALSIRRTLELAALGLYVKGLEQTGLKRLRLFCTAFQPGYISDPQISDSQVFERYLDVDNAFHQGLADMSRNAPLSRSVEKIIWLSTLIRRRQYYGSDYNENPVSHINEHLGILDALEAQDFEGATTILDQHLIMEMTRALTSALVF